MSLLKFLLKKNIPTPKLDSYSSYLFVGPHPDDIEVACGATVASLVASGKKVSMLVVTDGSGGAIDDNLQGDELVATRKQECKQSAELLGVTDLHFLHYVDGGINDLTQMAIDIAGVINKVGAEVVLTTDYTVTSECHPDHLNVGKATTDAFFYVQYPRVASRLGLAVTNVKAISYYYTSKPNSFIAVGKFVKRKFEAVACHKSQFDENGVKDVKLYFTLRNLRFASKNWFKRSEGYRTLTVQQSHCLPEYGE